ncbi:MAG TPA: tetratricopeptide repeat protein [Planctomycetaceae bacterium]|nr:tetratricopeptide repeat protein [Planctomycetaceae bacterium]
MEPSGGPKPEQLEQVQQLWERGLYRHAYEVARGWGELTSWQGTRARLLAGRMAIQLGTPTLGIWLLRRVWRDAPDDAEAQYYYASCLWQLRGPYPAWQWAQRAGQFPEEAEPELRGAWLALRGGVAGQLRDFEEAEAWLEQARRAAPHSPWVEVCRVQVLEAEDRYDDAEAAARRALQMRPWYRPAVQVAAHVLTLVGKDQEAIQLLLEADKHLEAAIVPAMLYGLQLELEQYEAARVSLERCAELMPLADKRMRKWLAAQRAEVAYRLGDFETAVRQAEACDEEFTKTLVERLRDPQRRSAPVKTLAVGFVRQHHLTCAPATLAAISRYWSMPADHLQVAEEICYNGTSAYSERKWAEDHGWFTREFTVTEPSARALIDRGIPFTLTTVDPGGAHLQAVIGYDGCRGTLVVRDPYERHSREALADKLLERYRGHGPRGMAMVPRDRRALLEEVELPDAALWDQLYGLDHALTGHRRQEAQAIYEAMCASPGDHRLVHKARRRLALYDENTMEQLAAVKQLLQWAPDDPTLQLARLACLRDLARREDRLAAYKKLSEVKQPHPVVWQQYAQELRCDARRHDDAIWLLRRAIRRWPSEAANYYILANIYWDQRRFDDAVPLYRFAACLGDKEEQFAHAYFMASLSVKQTERALRFLRDRFERFGARSSLPARTLFSAYMQLDRMQDALSVLDQALRRRPDDGELMLFAADAYPSCSAEHLPRAQQLLERAKEKVPAGAWRRTAARMATLAGRLTEALEHWQQVLLLQPLALDAHQAVAQLLAETRGRAAALAHLEQAAERFPHHHGLHELWVDWVSDEPAEQREPVLRRVLAAHPEDARVRRQLAVLLGHQRRFDEAWDEIRAADQLEPPTPAACLARAELYELENKVDQAKAELRKAIELSVDEDVAITALVDLCSTPAERREALAFVKSELERQVIFGDGLVVFRLHACRTLPAEELLAMLREALQARPDLWHAWSAMVSQLVEMNRLDEAWQVALEATERFPLVARLWLDYARVCQARGDVVGELEALRTAYQIAPQWGVAVRCLCELHQRRGDYERARQLLEQAVARSPLDPYNHLMLADTLWRLGQRDEALKRAEQAVQVEPGCEPAWRRLSEWSDLMDCPQRALEAARQLTRTRAGEARSWLMLAQLLDDGSQREERLAALARAIQLSPRCEDAYDLQAATLAEAGRWDEALTACHPPAWKDHPPTALRARAAWIQARRGDMPGAIRQMRELVRDEPNYYEGWMRLAEWYAYLHDDDAYLEAAEALVHIQPHEEVSFGYLGDARLRNGDRQGAREAFQRAFELAPAYEPAGNALFDLQLEDDDLEGAAETIKTLEIHVDSPFVTARRVQLAARRLDLGAAREGLKRVCLTPCDSEWPVHGAVEAFCQAGWQQEAEAMIGELLGEPKLHPAAAAQWVRLRTANKDWNLDDQLRQLAENSDQGWQATYAYVERLFQARAAGRLKQFICRQGQWLRARTTTWGAVGYGLVGLRLFRSAARWMGDWQQRPDAEPWMLVNAAEAFRATGQHDQAVAVSRHALTLPPGYGQHLHHLWLATDEVLAGNIQAAREHLQYAASEPLDQDYQFLQAVVQCILDMASAAPPEGKKTFRQVRKRIIQARRTCPTYWQEPARRRCYRQALRLIARHAGTTQARLWFWISWIRSFL